MKINNYCFLLLFSTIFILSQNKNSTTHLSTLSNTTTYHKIDSLFKPLRDTIQLQKLFQIYKNKNKSIEAYISNQLGVVYRDISNYKRSLYYHNHALNLSSKNTNPLFEITSLNMLGVVYRRMDSIKPAIDYHQRALSLINKLKNESIDLSKQKAISLNSLGNIYLTLNQFEMALKQFEQSLAIEKKLNNHLGIAINYQNIGGVYENLNLLDLALLNYKKSLDENKIINSAIGFMICNNSIGIVLLKQNKSKEAINYILPTIKTAIASKDDYYIASSYINLGWAYSESNNYSLAKENLSKGIEISKTKNFPSYLSLGYKVLSEINEKEGNYKLSNYYLKEHFKYKENITSGKNLKYLFDFISKYEIEKKENLLKSKDDELKINKLKLDAKEKQKWIYIFGILIFAIVGGLLFYQNQNRKRINEKLQVLNSELEEANSTKTRFFSILNHDLRAPVANLIHFLHLKNDHPELLDKETRTRLENQTIKGAENLLTSMEDLLIWSKSQMENFNPKFTEVSIDHLFIETKNHFSIIDQVELIFENSEKLIIYTDENYLKTIIRNLTGNAIKALSTTNNPKLIWKAWSNQGTYFLSITDNGLGADKLKFKALYDEKEVIGINSGFGLHLIRDLAKAIHCNITVQSEVEKGTTIILCIKKA